MNRLPTNRGFWLTLLYSILTLGFYTLYLIYAFAKETNTACVADGKRTQGLVVYLLLGFVTCGIYPIVWECMWINRCNAYLIRTDKPEGLQVSTYLLTLFLLGWLTLGIMYLVVFCKSCICKTQLMKPTTNYTACRTHVKKSIPLLSQNTGNCGYGGTGRRARLRIWCRKAWGSSPFTRTTHQLGALPSM